MPRKKKLTAPIYKVDQPMRFQYFFTEDGVSNFLVSRTPSLFTKYGSAEGNINVLGCVTSFGEDFGVYFTDELED